MSYMSEDVCNTVAHIGVFEYAISTVVSSHSSDNVSSLFNVLKYNSGYVLQVARFKELRWHKTPSRIV